MKLELKHVCIYLPYNLRIKDRFDDSEIIMNNHSMMEVVNGYFNPILCPLSEMDDRISNDCGYADKHMFINAILREEVQVCIWNDLLNNHWDVFNLIPAGLAIDESTLTPIPQSGITKE